MVLRTRGAMVVVAALAVLTALPAAAPAARPKAFASCGSLLGHEHRQALRMLRQGAAPGVGFTTPGAQRNPPHLPMPATGAPTDGGPGGKTEAAPDHSTTNVQEEGVDEPDIVKSDGNRIFSAGAGILRAFEVRAGVARLAGTLKLEGYSHQLLLRGDRLLVISPGDGPYALAMAAQARPMPVGMIAPYYYRPQTVLSEIDVSDPTAMKLVRTLETPGSYLDARRSDGTARVVISSPPEPIELPPAPAEGEPPLTADQQAIQQRQAVAKSPLHTWRPSYVLHNRVKGTALRRPVARCTGVRRPGRFSGLGLVSVLTIDLDEGLRVVDSDALIADADTVYASPTSLYLTSRVWFDETDPPKSLETGSYTTIHKLDVSDPHRTVFRASGAVRGFGLNQWSLSEYEGRLRVATTDEPPWSAVETGAKSESFVTVLEERAGALVPVGRVGDLGKDERIYAVRFIGERGYVVTFRQVDPLYALDLSDPANPRVTGELKIRGYSAYLHPVGEGLLLGVGQDATEEGRRKGVQISLFDVSDPRHPSRLAQAPLGDYSNSEAEYDHHAFLWWPATTLAVIPLQVYPAKEGDDSFDGAVGFRVDREKGIEEIGRVKHRGAQYGGSIRRSLVIGDRLFTVSDAGLMTSDVESLKEGAWLPFETDQTPQPQPQPQPQQ